MLRPYRCVITHGSLLLFFLMFNLVESSSLLPDLSVLESSLHGVIENTIPAPSELFWKNLSRAMTLTRTSGIPVLVGNCQLKLRELALSPLVIR